MKTMMFCCLVCLPLKSLLVTSGFGYRPHPLTGRYAFHNGVDLRARGDTVYAVMDGMVERASYQDGLGLYVRLASEPVSTTYGHLSQILIAENQEVHVGEPIAISGSTGRVTAPHLHFSLCYRGRYIDPLQFLFHMLKQNDHEQKF